MATILIIEDNEIIRENAIELLELEGYNVLGASNGRLGIDKALEKVPQLILCDIHMPKADGYEVFAVLKENPETAAIPFVFLTASAELSDKKIGLDMGADDYIRKPFDEVKLLTVVKNCLNKV